MAAAARGAAAELGAAPHRARLGVGLGLPATSRPAPRRGGSRGSGQRSLRRCRDRCSGVHQTCQRHLVAGCCRDLQQRTRPRGTAQPGEGEGVSHGSAPRTTLSPVAPAPLAGGCCSKLTPRAMPQHAVGGAGRPLASSLWLGRCGRLSATGLLCLQEGTGHR